MTESIANICAERIHEARRRLRMTQSDFAARLQVAGIIIEWERPAKQKLIFPLL
jgi:DNA-binding transcriptional regulator YiaG